MANKGSIDLSKVIQGSDKFVQMADTVTKAADKLVDALNESQKTSTTNIKIKADYEDLEKANKILEEMEAARKSPRLIDVATIDNNGNEIYQKASNPQHISNVSQASNYYKSIDTAKNAMAEQWNKLVGYMENNPAVNLESMVNSKQSLSTSVLRYANAFEALGGDISSVSEELATFVSQMRNLDELSASKGFSFTVDNFKNIFSYLDRLRDEAGAVFSDFNIKDSLHIDFRSMPKTAFGTNTSANEGAKEAEEAAERTEEAAEKTKEAAKKYAEATREINAAESEGDNIIDSEPRVDESSAEISAQADQKAADAARDRTEANNALAESEQNVAAAESAHTDVTGKPIDTEQSDDHNEQDISAEATAFNDVSSKVGSVNTELAKKNELLTQEAQIVDGSIQGEVESFEAVEFAIKAIVEQLTQLVEILPQASFDNFIGQDSQTKISTLLTDLTSLTRTLGTIDDQDVFSHLNNLLQSPSQEIGSNIDTITTKFKDLRTVMNGFDDNGSAVFKSLSDLANAGDAMVEKMQKLFSESGVKLPAATVTKSKDISTASTLMSTQRAEILDAVDNYVSQQPDNLEVVATKMQAGANGIVKVIATVKEALEDGSVAFKEFTFNASDTGDGLNVLLSGTKEGGTTLERQAQAYQKFKEAISDSEEELQTLGDVIGGEVFTQDSAGWPQLIELAREFGMELEDIDKITRKVQNGFESFTFLTKDGVSKTLGFSSDRVLLQTDPVLDRKAEEKARIAEERAAQQRAEADAKQEAEVVKERQRINEEYAQSIEDSITKISEARATYNQLSADFQTGKANVQQVENARRQLEEAITEAKRLISEANKFTDVNGNQYFTDERIGQWTEKAERASDITPEEAKRFAKNDQDQIKATQKAVDELTQSYERLADAENKAANGSTAAIREKGATTAQQIQARQKELEEQIADKTTKEQDARIEAAKKYYARLQTAYESQNTTSPSKDLGFGPDSNVEKTWDVLIAKAQQYQNILNKNENLHQPLTVNEQAFLTNFSDLYDQAIKEAEQAGEKGQKFIDAMEAARSNIRTNTINKFDNVIGNLKATDKSMPKAYNDQVVELQANLEKLKNTDFGSQQWGQTIKDLRSGLESLNNDPNMQKVDKLAKETLNRQMSDWINNNSGAGEYLDQVRALQTELQNAASAGDLERIATGFEKVKSSAAEAGKTGESFGEGLMKRFKSLGQYLLSFASFYRVIDVFKQAIGIVKQLDTALVELKKVSDESTKTYDNFMKSSFDMADKVGTTAQSIISSTADWKRLGESFEEAQKSATTSTVLLNVSEFTNIEDATQSLVSASQAYKDLDKMDIVDKLNNIGNNFSVSTNDLATGLKNAAAVLATQGNDIDQALALLTAGNALPGNTEMYFLEYI